MASSITGFLTPSFELSQDNDFVKVRIRLPHLKADEGEFYVLDREFKFHLRPYFLRLTFRHSLIEDGRERAEHDLDSGVLTVWLPKATPGEHFEGLNLLTELLRKPSSARSRPLIEVISSSDNADGQERMCVDGDTSGTRADGLDDDFVGDQEDDDDDLESDLGHLAEAEQELPPLLSDRRGSAAYGFNGAFSNIFVGLEDEELVEVPDPEASSAATRRAGRLAAEDAAFDADHYIGDLMDDERAVAALDYVPWWRGADVHSWSDETGAGSRARPASGTLGDDSASGERAQGDETPFGMSSEYNAQLLQLPRKEFLLDTAQRRRALCGLVDLLFAYAYDVRTTEGEPTVESGWTVRHLSATLAWLDCFESVAEAAVASVERSLCYPLVRHFKLALATLSDVVVLLRLGRTAVLRALLDTKLVVQRGVEHGYLLNRIWVDEYCMWLQQLPPRWLNKLADKLESVKMRRDLVRWPLQAYEDLAAEEQGEEEEDGQEEVTATHVGSRVLAQEDDVQMAQADIGGVLV